MFINHFIRMKDGSVHLSNNTYLVFTDTDKSNN